MTRSPFVIPSVGPDPIAFDDAVAATLGYALARRDLKLKTPTYPDGHKVRIPAYAYETYDCIAPSPEPEITHWDVLVVDGLNGRLGQKEIEALKDAALRAEKHIANAVLLAGGRAFWELPEAEVLVSPTPGSAGEALAAAWAEFTGTHFVDVARTHKVLHHKHPRLFPLIDGPTSRRLKDHTKRGVRGPWAVIHRELTENEAQFAALEEVVSDQLPTALERLRLHDVLLWLSASRNLTHAMEAGRSTPEWRAYQGS